MSVHVVHLFGADPGRAQGLCHCAKGLLSAWLGGGHVMGVVRIPVTGDPGVHACAPGPSSLFLFQEQDGGPLTHDETVSAGVEGTA